MVWKASARPVGSLRHIYCMRNVECKGLTSPDIWRLKSHRSINKTTWSVLADSDYVRDFSQNGSFFFSCFTYTWASRFGSVAVVWLFSPPRSFLNMTIMPPRNIWRVVALSSRTSGSTCWRPCASSDCYASCRSWTATRSTALWSSPCSCPPSPCWPTGWRVFGTSSAAARFKVMAPPPGI